MASKMGRRGSATAFSDTPPSTTAQIREYAKSCFIGRSNNAETTNGFAVRTTILGQSTVKHNAFGASFQPLPLVKRLITALLPQNRRQLLCPRWELPPLARTRQLFVGIFGCRRLADGLVVQPRHGRQLHPSANELKRGLVRCTGSSFRIPNRYKPGFPPRAAHRTVRADHRLRITPGGVTCL
jgi:hypothetical protein